jgi:hypothetical protein
MRGALDGEQVETRGPKKLHDLVVLERARVRDIDDHTRACDSIGEALAGNRIDAEVRGCRDHVMATTAKDHHQLRSDETAASDDYDSHVVLPRT